MANMLISTRFLAHGRKEQLFERSAYSYAKYCVSLTILSYLFERFNASCLIDTLKIYA